MTQTQTAPQNKFAALDQKVSDSRENEKLQAQQQSPQPGGDDGKKPQQPGTRPDDKQAETKPQSPQQGEKPASNN